MKKSSLIDPAIFRFDEPVREYFWGADKETTLTILAVASIASLFFVLFDYLFFGPGNAFLLFAFIRVLFVTYTIQTIWYIRSRASLEHFDALLLVWTVLLSVTMMFFPIYSKFSKFESNLVIHSVVILCAYVVIPIRPAYRILAAAPLFLFDVIAMASGSTQLTAAEVFANILSLSTVSLIGFLTTVSISSSKLREYHSLQQERAEKLRFEELAMIDSLTGVYTRRYFMILLESEYERYKRHGQKFSLVVADIDNFKQINDRFTHSGGDEVLRAFCGQMSAQKRLSDCVGRLGGDEFAILFPNTKKDAALKVVERFCENGLGAAAPSRKGKISFKFSGGVTEVQSGDNNVEQVIQRADKILYEVK
ncbi:MAG TPA: GGDEF domain-containing protein, partial [Anaerolineales bacterium]|nr:GGDEF domain-containing protein [Anaerolineales bacterium]